MARAMARTSFCPAPCPYFIEDSKRALEESEWAVLIVCVGATSPRVHHADTGSSDTVDATTNSTRRSGHRLTWGSPAGGGHSAFSML